MKPTLLLAGLLLGVALPGRTAPPTALPDGVQLQTNLPFLGAERTEMADVYLPAKLPPAGTLRPAVIMIHGGGFTGGRRNDGRERNVCGTLAAHGYVAVSIDYRLATKEHPVAWPQNLHDCQQAVRWLRRNAAQWQVDPDRIGVIGGSAGATLASLVALTGPGDGLDPDGPDKDVSCRVQCAVDLYGPADLMTWHDVSMLGKKRSEDPELYRKASPATYADPKDPPFLILHGTADKIVDVSQSRDFAAALKKAGVPVELEIIEGAPHTFHLQPKERDLRPLVLGFFDRHLRPAQGK